MIAFDADVLTDILGGHADYSRRAALIPVHEQSVPIIVVEEILRGRLNSIRRAEGARSKVSIDRCYALLEYSLDAFRHVLVLSHTAAAEALFQEWRDRGMRVGTHDLRIAAICVTSASTLVTRNRRDFESILLA